MLQFKVPQNIKMPDQIIGPLTLEQFLYLLFGLGMIYIAYIYVGYNNFFYILSIPIALIAVAFAFVPVNEQPFSKFVANMIIFLIKPKTLIWLQLPPEVFASAPQETVKDDKSEIEAIKHPEEIRSQLQQLSLILDTRMSAQDIRTKATDLHENQHQSTQKSTATFSTDTKNTKLPINAITTNIQSEFKKLSSTISKIFQPKPQTQSTINEEARKQQEIKKQKMLEISKM